MNPANLISETYDRKARLYPSLLLVSPIVAAAVAILSTKLSGLQSFGAILVGCGGAFLFTELARDAGKKGEAGLFKKWGGLPSIAIFRHRDSRLPPITKARCHKKLASLVKEAKAPSVEEELANPSAADEIYAAWSYHLRVSTRDTKKFALLFRENVSYGYRRNVWGLRPFGMAVSLASAVVCVAHSYFTYQSTGKMEEVVALGGAFSVVLLALWIFRFTEEWVRIPADAYAERLIECSETLGTKTATNKE